MDECSTDRRLRGVLRFLADLTDVAAECAASGATGDELTARRRLRLGARTAEPARDRREAQAR